MAFHNLKNEQNFNDAADDMLMAAREKKPWQVAIETIRLGQELTNDGLDEMAYGLKTERPVCIIRALPKIATGSWIQICSVPIGTAITIAANKGKL